MTCAKCDDVGGRPVDWVDVNGVTHHDFAYCDCAAAAARIARAERLSWHHTETYGT